MTKRATGEAVKTVSATVGEKVQGGWRRQRTLDGRPDGDGNGQVQLVLGGDCDGRDMLGGVTDEGQEDESDEALRNAARLDEAFNGRHQPLGSDARYHRDDDEEQDGDATEHLGRVRVKRVVRRGARRRLRARA